jgi:uncharacterized protein (DUF433 family)
MDGRRWRIAGVLIGSVGLGTALGATVFSPGIGFADGTALMAEECIGPMGAGPLSAAAEAIGILPPELMEELRSGNTIADVAEEYDADVDEVIDAMVEAERDRLDRAVEDGWITQEQADERAQGLVERMTDLVNGDLLPFPGPIALPRGRGFGDGPIAAAAETIGITPAELLEELGDGSPIADVAEKHGVDAGAVIDAIVEAMRERLDQAVEDGWLTQERADALAGAFEERAADLVNGEPLPFPRPGWHRGPFGGPNLDVDLPLEPTTG